MTRLVLLGDSILGHWPLPGVVNHGVGWDTTSQMLARFASDVLRARPARAVLILGGTNDVRARWCFPRLVAGRVLKMARMASDAGVRPIVGTVPPQAKYRQRIEKINARLARSANGLSPFGLPGFELADFHAALTDGAGGMRADYSEDGVHPNGAGYEAMRRVLEDLWTP